ncbi:bromodomain adjacent to zinc finger domain protein 2A isoform X2 [Hyla sarda]|uniref:bromodomain adjacent to zinc finger domain protein 2A isoform X2 n=1 Tax=Hyla sarda TaxID=327740 RepID=UPI0024C2BCCA|nr:bromodomain adjacent to zinc finger domain protein 2A isoform X2 [Hyla sarda]
METNNHFGSTGQPPLSSASGLKQLPQLVEPVYTHNSLVIFPQQAKGLNCDMPVNGLISPSIPTNPHGTYASDASTTSHPASNNFDYLWKYPKSTIMIDSLGPSLHQVNGSASPLTNGPFCKGSSQDAWENSASSHPASLTISGQDLCNFSNSNVKVAAAVNETHCFSETYCPAPASPVSSVRCVSVTSQSQEAQQGKVSDAAKILENDEILTEAGESSDIQTGHRISEHNGPDLAIEQRSPSASSQSPPTSPDVICQNVLSPLPSHLEDCHVLNSDTAMDTSDNEDSGDSVSRTLDNPEESEVVMQQKEENPPVESPDLDCLSQSDAAFCPVVEEVENSCLSRSVSASPELGDSEVQDNRSDMDKSPEGIKAEEPSTALETNSLNEIYIDNTTPEPSTVPDAEEEDLEPGEVKGATVRRRVATPEDVRHPLLHGWKREVRIKKGSHRWQGETWYYAPCGKRMKQFPEVIKYLSKYAGPHVRREHFSFSPRMPVGDFYEERHTPEGSKWVLLSSEEIPSRILAITGKRGRPRNMEKAKAKENKVKRGRGRPPKVKMIDLLSKPDAKLLRKLENQDILSDVEKVQLSKLRKKMRRKARNQEAKQEAAKKLKLREKKEREKEEKEQKIKEAEQMEAKKKARRKLKQKVTTPPVPKPDRKQLAQQRRLEERKRQQFMLEELKKPTEDMCLPDHQPLPDIPHVPGVVLPSSAFSHCLTTVEFLQTYGKVFGLDETKDIPSLLTLQEGLFNIGDSLGEVQDLLVKLLRVALFDPGLPSYCQSLKILGEKVSETSLTRENVSEILRIFLEAYGGDIDLCESLRTHPFQAHPPHTKAAVLAFLINELNASTLIISEIDKTLENMSNYRKNKWIIEGKIRRLKFALGKKTGREELQVNIAEDCRTRRNTRNNEENEDAVGNESALLKPTEDEKEEVSSNVNTLELERQIEKLTKRQMFLRKKIISCSQRLRCMSLGQDRFRRFYWMLPRIGGIFVEGLTDSTVMTSYTPQTELPESLGMKNEEKEGTEDKFFCSFNRSRGRPRKSEHCKYCQCLGPQQAPLNGLLQANLSEGQQDISQTTVLSWLTQCQTPIVNSAVLTPENSPPHTEGTSTFDIGPCPGATDTDEKDNRLFNSLLRTHCTENFPNLNSQSNTLLSPSSLAATTEPVQGRGLADEQHQSVGSQLPPVSSVCQVCNKPVSNATTAMEKRRGRPSGKLITQIEQRYFSQLVERPIPENMKYGWWWIKDPAVLESLLKALHPRGIREKSLHKHLTKHLVHLKEMCARSATDGLFQFKPSEGHPVSQETLDKWSVEQWTFQVDLSVLQWVEDLEQRVMMSDLQLRGWSPPSLDSVRSDLKYFEHKVEASDDILAKVKREEGRAHREPDNPLDIAVLRLLDMEQNVERRYLKEPLWILSEVQQEKIVITDAETLSTTEIQYSITSRLRLWRQTVERCRSSAQLALCLQQLEKSLAWERSVNKVQGESEYLRPGGSSKRAKKSVQRYQDNSPLKQSRRKEPAAASTQSPVEASLAKRRRIGTRSQCPDLTFCEIILMEMESHDDAWPFLEPVNPRLVPGYRKIIKNPMDFSTMRNKLLNGRYSSCKEFADDAELVFSNCQLFNEDDSEVGKAGLALKKFYESRWEEFNQERENNSL